MTFFKRLFNKTTKPKLDDIKSLTKRIIDTTFSQLNTKNKEIENCLELMKEYLECTKIERNQSNSNMQNAGDWLNGMSFATNAMMLSEKFEKTDRTNDFYEFTKVWTQATLLFAGHYLNLVGPAMIKYANSSRKFGKTEEARQASLSILLDFNFIIEIYESDPNLNEEDKVTMESLIQASDLYKEIETNVSDNIREILSRVEKITEPNKGYTT